MITICCDFNKCYQGRSDPSIWIARQTQDYIPLRQYLRRALNDPDHTYTIYVQHRVLAEWLRDLRAYPTHLLRWEEAVIESATSLDTLVEGGLTVASALIGSLQQIPSEPEAQISKISILPPTLKLEGYLQPERTTTGRVIVVNPNEICFSDVKLKIDSVQLPIEWPELQPNTEYLVNIQFVARKIKNAKHPLVWKLTCEHDGQQWEFEDYAEIPVRQFQTSEVDAMFEGSL